jgi:DNA primase
MKHKQFFISEDRLEELLEQVGVKIAYHTSTDIACYCPFHDNRDSPAFNISKHTYLWKCWNGKCNQHGNLITLLTKKGYTNSEAKRMLLTGEINSDDFADYIANILKEDDDANNEWDGFDTQIFRDEDESNGFTARQYLEDRGISNESYDHFRMGYSSKKRMLVIPVFTERGKLAGIIGRSIENKRYQYSSGLDRSGILWGLNFALQDRHANDLILTEGALDAVAIWQSGAKCVAAVLGSAISKNQWKLIKENFVNVTCFFDNDDAGNALRNSILEDQPDLGTSCVTYPSRLVTLSDGSTRPIKDPGELTDSEIRQMLSNRKTRIEMLFEQHL